jgi:hypothetical protein
MQQPNQSIVTIVTIVTQIWPKVARSKPANGGSPRPASSSLERALSASPF